VLDQIGKLYADSEHRHLRGDRPVRPEGREPPGDAQPAAELDVTAGQGAAG
jgi:hypothetical protein